MHSQYEAAENLLLDKFKKIGLSELIDCLASGSERLIAELDCKLIDTLDDKSKVMRIFLKRAKINGLCDFLDSITNTYNELVEVEEALFDIFINNQESLDILIEYALIAYSDEIANAA